MEHLKIIKFNFMSKHLTISMPRCKEWRGTFLTSSLAFVILKVIVMMLSMSASLSGSRARRPRVPPLPVVPQQPHALRLVDGFLTCDCCTRRAMTHAGRRRMQYEECTQQHGYDRRLRKNGVHDQRLQHVLWRTGSWTWCHKCGLHSMYKVLGLAMRCKGKFINSQARQRRDRMRNGRHPYSDIELGVIPRPMPQRGRQRPDFRLAPNCRLEDMPDFGLEGRV